MPIEVTCQCGKKLKAPDKMAGKKARCPKCKQVVSIPAAADEDTYEMDLGEPDAGGGAGGSRIVAAAAAGAPAGASPDPPAGGTEGGRTCPECGAAMGVRAVLCMNCGFNTITGQQAAAKQYAGDEGPEPLFNVAGIDFTRGRLAIAGGVVALLIAACAWWYLGPARNVRVLRIERVRAVDVLAMLKTREPFSLLTGEGDAALGVKAPPLKNGPQGPVKEIEYTMGGNDELIVTEPDAGGGYLLVELELSQAILNAYGGTHRYDLVFGSNFFRLYPAGGGQPVKPRMLFAKMKGRADINIGGSDATSHIAPMPPDIEPAEEKDMKKFSGGYASGTLVYDGSRGVTGSFDFHSNYYASGAAPGVTGLTASGKLTRNDGKGGKIEYDYAGSQVSVTWDKAASGWWCKNQYNEKEGMSPYTKYRVLMLFERPSSKGDMRLVLGKKDEYELTEIDAEYAATGAKPNDSSSAVPLIPSGRKKPPKITGGYFSSLAQAQQRAKGTVSMSNMRQIGMGMQLYAAAHNGGLPDTLEDLRPHIGALDELLKNKRTGDNPGFIYEKPAGRLTELSHPERVPVLFESAGGKKDPSGWVMYADGHFEFGFKRGSAGGTAAGSPGGLPINLPTGVPGAR